MKDLYSYHFIFIDKIDKYANPKDKSGETPLHWAAWNGNIYICQMIIENVVDKNPKDNGGYTPLHIAAEKGHTGFLVHQNPSNICND